MQRLENDSQLATVLADNIACALEKQELRQIPTRRAMTAGNVALTAGGFFVPGLGLTGLAAGSASSETMQKHAEEQSGRVSLVLLHQAGYDIGEAPKGVVASKFVQAQADCRDHNALPRVVSLPHPGHHLASADDRSP